MVVSSKAFSVGFSVSPPGSSVGPFPVRVSFSSRLVARLESFSFGLLLSGRLSVGGELLLAVSSSGTLNNHF